MSISIADFWRLAADSQLFTAADCQKLESQFSQVKGASAQSNARTLVEWLVANRALSRFQGTVLLAGRPGPFIYADYRVFDRVGQGRLTGQFRATHARTGFVVGLHFLSGAAARDPNAWAAAATQLSAASRLIHPYLSRVFAPVQSGNYRFVVIEDLTGQTLADRLSAHGRTETSMACRWARQAALGLAKAHELGTAHGDLRPNNILIDSQDNAKLLQLPLSRSPHLPAGPIDWQFPSAEMPLPEMADYLAPELARPGVSRDFRSDIYALGATLYQMLSGHPPFRGRDVAETMSRAVQQTAEPLSKLGISPSLAKLVERMMAKDPAQRGFTAQGVADALAPLVEPAHRAVPQPAANPKLASFEQCLLHTAATPAMQAPALQIPALRIPALQIPALQIPAVQFPAAGQAAAMPGQPAPFTTSVAPVAAAPQTNAPQIVAPPVAAPQISSPQVAAPPIQIPAATAPPLAAQASPTGGDFFDELSQPGGRTIGSRRGRRSGATHEAAMDFLDQNLGGAATATAPSAAAGFPEFADLGQPVARAPVDSFPAEFASAPSSASAGLPFSIEPATTGPMAAMSFPDMAASPAAAKPAAQRRPRPKEPLSPLTLGLSIGGGVLALLVIGAISISMLSPAPTKKIVYKYVDDDPAPTKTITPPKPAGPPANPASNPNSGSQLPASNGGTPTTNPPPAATEVVSDDGNSLWRSPTAGSPLDLKYLPHTVIPQAVVAVRLADLCKNPEWTNVQASLGPFGAQAAQYVSQIASCEPGMVDQLIAGFGENAKGEITMTLVLRLREKISSDTRAYLMQGGGVSEKSDAGELITGGKLAYYLPSKENDRILVSGEAATLKDIAADPQPHLALELEPLVKLTDANRHFTLLFSNKYFLDEKTPQLPGELQPLRELMTSFIGDDVRSAAVSMHLTDTFFVELRTNGGGPSGYLKADECRAKLNAASNQLSDSNAMHPHPPYSAKILARYPRMIERLAEYSRRGEEEGQGVLRAVLPAVAAHNLLMGTELSIAERPAGVVVAKGPAKQTPMAERLNMPISMVFPNNSLETSISIFAGEIGGKVEIIGGDLQLEGITKNQAITKFDQKDQPAKEILQLILKQANPDGKLVYFIKDKDGEEVLYISTKAATTKRGEKLPPEFAGAAAPTKPVPKKK